MAKVDYTDAELDAAERQMKASTAPASEGFVVRRLLQLAEGTGASVKKRLDPLQKRRRADRAHGQGAATAIGDECQNRRAGTKTRGARKVIDAAAAARVVNIESIDTQDDGRGIYAWLRLADGRVALWTFDPRFPQVRRSRSTSSTVPEFDCAE